MLTAWYSFDFIVVVSWYQRRKALVSSLQGNLILHHSRYAALLTLFIGCLMEVSIIAVHDHTHIQMTHVLYHLGLLKGWSAPSGISMGALVS